ncbi:helix-turn-helix domain-containing protein [Bacillus cereus]
MKRIKFKLKNVLIENKINQNKLVQILKVMNPSTVNGMNPSTVNGMSNEDIKKINIETLAKVSDYFKKTILGNYS